MSITSETARVRARSRMETPTQPAQGTMAQAPALATETAVTMFAIASGVGGAVSQLLAANKLSTTAQEEIPVSNLLLPVGLATAGAVVGASLLPGEFDLPSPRKAVRKPRRFS